MQRIMKQHVNLHEATGGRIQEDKSQMFAWQWKLENGEQHIECKQNRLSAHEKQVKQMKIDECVHTLGVIMGPSLKWTNQFLKMKEKTVESVRKLMNTELKAWQVHVYFNMYVIKSVFFGCGVVS